MSQEKHLKLPSSSNFEDSSFIDNIRQLYIDLITEIENFEADENEIKKNISAFLLETLKYLEKDLPYNAANELFSVISLCFSYYEDEYLPCFKKIFEKSRFNSNFIIVTSSIMYQLSDSGYKFSDQENNFITDALKEILPQIQSRSQTWTIFNHKILPQFQDEFLINLLLSIEVTQEIFFNFYRFIFSRNMSSLSQKFDLLVLILSNSDLIEIAPLTETANNELFEFICSENFELISKMSFESFLLVSAAVISVENHGEIVFDGITEDSILQFISIVAVIQKKKSSEINIESIEISELICSKIESLKPLESPVFKESLKIIIDVLINPTKYNLKFSPKHSFKIMISIIKKFIKDDDFLIEKGQIYKYILFLTSISGNLMINNFLNRINVFNFIMNHLSELNSLQIFNYPKFNLNSIKPLTIVEYLNGLQNSEDVVRCLSFISCSCENLPKIAESKNLNEKLMKIFNEKVKEKNLKEALLVGQFLQKHFYVESFEENLPKTLNYLLLNDFQTNEDELTIDYIIELILSSPDPENHDEFFNTLTKQILKNEEMLQMYLNYVVTVYRSSKFNIDYFLTKSIIQFTLFKDEFIKTVKRYYYFDGQFLIKKIDYSLSELPIPEFGVSIVSKLLESIEKKNDNYQAFICLKNIVCTFPFLFGKDPQKIFDIVIKSFDYISLLFENKTDVLNKEELIKTSLSAVSFLFSTFRAQFLFDKFLHFMFKNILTFTNEQIACFMIMLRSFYNDGLFHCIILAYFIKYDFMNSVGKLLEREISNESFRNFYRCSIYIFLSRSFEALSKLGHYEIVQIKEFEKMEFPFNYMYDYIYLTSPCLFEIIEGENMKIFNKISNFNHFTNFIQNIESLKTFWISEYIYELENKEPTHVQINNFIQELRKEQLTEIDENSIPFSFPNLTVKMTRYLVLNRSFIYCWYLYSIKFPLVQPLFDELIKTAEVLNKMKIEAKENPDDEDNKDVLSIDIDSYMMKCYSQKNLLTNLLKQLIDTPYGYYYETISNAILNICLKNVGISTFIDSVSKFFVDNCDNDSSLVLNQMNNILDFLLFLPKNDFFYDYFVKSKCCDNIIDAILSPKIRNNPKILKKSSSLFITFDKNIPTRVTNLIGFIFLSNFDGMFETALKLISKFSQEQLIHLNKIILMQFDQELMKGKVTDNLYYFLKYFKNAAKERKDKLIKLLNKQFENYENEETLEDIGVILSALAPERGQIKNTTNEISNDSIIPIFIKETSPEFWNLFEQYSPILMNEISENPLMLYNFSFLLDFPELVSFNIRSSYFKKKNNLRIQNKSFTDLYIDRDKILETSFEEMKNLTKNDYLNTIRVQFTDEPVEDFGGGRREWFELLIKELFNTKNDLFECSKNNKNYQPNHLTTKNLNYFNFAGKIIARILIEGQCIDAHLTQSFYKQILHLEPNFEDLKDFDSELYQGLEWILKNDVNSLDFFFTIDVNNNENKIKTIPLKENGENIKVNNDNKKEYIDLYSNFILKKQIEKQLNAFIDGFNSLISPKGIKFFNQNELDLLLCGIPKFDVDDFKANTVYDHPYNAESPVIKMFFNVISKWNNDELAKLLMFMTGSSRVPANGFKEFCEMTHYPLKIDSGGDRSLLPQSHTCFNILHLPQYETEEEMNEKLHQVIQYCDTFGLI